MCRNVLVRNLGRMNYSCALELQNQLASQLKTSIEQNISQNGTILLVEHDPPVYTIGIRTKDYTIKDENNLRNLGAEFYKTNRGGLITFHGLGQLVVYPILNLKLFKPSMRWYVDQVEQTVIDMCKFLGVRAETSPHTGVWVNDKKICAIGVHGSRFVTTHGLALNCNTDLKWFSHIVPCGIEGKGVTSLSQELGRTVLVTEMIPLFLRCFGNRFQCKLIETEDYSLTVDSVFT